MQLPKVKKADEINHTVAYCYNCGWVHGHIEIKRVQTENGIAHRTYCHDCLKKEVVYAECFLCGEKKIKKEQGKNGLYAVSIEVKRLEKDNQEDRRMYDGTMYNSCRMVVGLCWDCRQLSHDKIRCKLAHDGNMPTYDKLCDNCTDKFICYTSQHLSPRDSRKVYGGEKIHKRVIH